MDNENLMNLEEAVKYSRLTEWQFKNLIRKGKMPFYRITNKVRLYDKRDIDEFLASCLKKTKTGGKN